MATPNEAVTQETSTTREGFSKREFGNEGILELPNEWIGLRPKDIVAEKDAEGNDNPFVAKFGENYRAAKKFVETFEAIPMLGGDIREYKQFRQMLNYMIVDDPERAEILKETTPEQITELEEKLTNDQQLDTIEARIIGAAVTERELDTLEAIQALAKAKKENDYELDNGILVYINTLLHSLHSDKVFNEKLREAGYNPSNTIEDIELTGEAEFLSGLPLLSSEGLLELIDLMETNRPKHAIQIKHLINYASANDSLRNPAVRVRKPKPKDLQEFAAAS